MNKDMPAVLYGLTALVWLINGICNGRPQHFALAAMFFAVSVMNWTSRKPEQEEGSTDDDS